MHYLKNMVAFRKMRHCIFCEIVARQSEASFVYEDQETLAFMNLRQANPGHVLVIPKCHIETVEALPLPTAGALFQTVVRVTRAVQATFAPEGLSLWQANGAAAGQEVPHVHIHVLPRYRGDRAVTFYPAVPPIAPRDKLDQLAAQIRKAMEVEQ